MPRPASLCGRQGLPRSPRVLTSLPEPLYARSPQLHGRGGMARKFVPLAVLVMEVKMLTQDKPMAVDHTHGTRVVLPYDNAGTQRSEVKMPPFKERRRRSRMDLHWPVCLSRSGRTEPVRSSTQNISSDGFYCLCQEPFVTGEQL